MNRIKSHTIFFGLALAGIAFLLIYTWLTAGPLNDNEAAKENVILFYHYNSFVTTGNYFLYLILLFVANIMYIRQRYWDTFIWAGIIFAAFTLVDWWWLGEKVFVYKKMNELWLGETNLGPFIGIMIALFGLGLAIANYMLLKRIVKEKNIVAQPNLPAVEDKKNS